MTDDATRAVLARIDDVRYFVQKATKWNDCAQELANELKVNEALNAMAARIAELEQDARKDTTRLDLLDTCDLSSLTRIINRCSDGNPVRYVIDVEFPITPTEPTP